jgi:hypothetical protein
MHKLTCFTRTQPSVNLLTQITLGSSVLASNLIHNQDRIGLAYIDRGSPLNFELLLSLGFHSMDTIRSALNTLSRRQHRNRSRGDLEIGNVIQKVSGLFSVCPRTAFCHLFFISATPPAHLAIPWIDQAIGFHTITPQPCLPLKHTGLQLGWHISYDVGIGNTCPKGTHFIRKVSRVVQQLRTGISPGSILNLKLSIIPDEGCQIHSVLDNSRLTSLRPGETWIVPIEINVPSAFQSISPSNRIGSLTYHPLIEEIISRINGLLMEFSSEEITQPILTAHVEYEHSLLPAPSTVHAESQLTVVRCEKTVVKSSLDFRQTILSTVDSGDELSVGLSVRSGST